jgi:hypothetical protein
MKGINLAESPVHCFCVFVGFDFLRHVEESLVFGGIVGRTAGLWFAGWHGLT